MAVARVVDYSTEDEEELLKKAGCKRALRVVEQTGMKISKKTRQALEDGTATEKTIYWVTHRKPYMMNLHHQYTEEGKPLPEYMKKADYKGNRTYPTPQPTPEPEAQEEAPQDQQHKSPTPKSPTPKPPSPQPEDQEEAPQEQQHKSPTPKSPSPQPAVEAAEEPPKKKKKTAAVTKIVLRRSSRIQQLCFD